MNENDWDMEIHAKKPEKKVSNIGWGIILIFVGLVFLLQRIGLWQGGFNWWAVFILLPAIGSLSGAYYALQRSGGVFNRAVRSSLGGGLIILTVAFMFLFDMDWDIWWPLMLIMPGFSMFLNGFVDGGKESAFSFRRFIQMGFWIGMGMMFLGAGFLLNNVELIFMSEVFKPFRWWAVAIMIPGFGAFLNAFLAFMDNEYRVNPGVISLTIIGITISIVAAVAFLGLNWNLITPVILIGIGIAVFVSGFIRSKE